MPNSNAELPARLTRSTLISVHIDICRATSIISEINDEIKIVLFFDGFYDLCGEHIDAAGGEVVKYMGDSCLAVFSEDKATEAIEAVANLRRAFDGYCKRKGVKATDIRARLHIGEVVIGEFGPRRQRDVLGRSSSLAIAMSGTGITLSEQVYRKLPSASRSPWKKQGAQVTYSMN